ncbi:MAG TPA: TfuA-like protein [Polyangiaceae bacterium]|nr:TfuA-like protein [Polyangiaceae bacterium]
MTKVVFTGPTLSAGDAREALDAVVLPPAAQGDVYRVASRQKPAAIGLVDGYFDTLPAVWHKEILWALREGIAVFGGGSMGALRAAELAGFGMRGVGDVFEAFAGGRLEDDDEVALAHETAERGYRALSEPMVNVRATLAAATAAGIVGEATRAGLVERVKALFYPDRTYARMLAEARAAGVIDDEVDRLAAWLPSGRVDVKRADALSMLRAMRDDAPPAEPPRFHFEETSYWEALRAQEDADLPRRR